MTEAPSFAWRTNGATWKIKNSGTTQNLIDVESKYEHHEIGGDIFYSWAIGDQSTVLFTFDGGDSWEKQSTPFPMDALKGVSFKDPDSGLIVGSQGIVYQTTNGGFNWVYKEADASNPNFRDVVYGDSGGVAVAVGENGVIYRSQDNGSTWSSTTSGTTKNLNSLAYGDSGFVAGGDDGTLLQSNKSGTGWQLIETGTTADFNEVYSDSGGAIWAVGDSGTIVTNSPEVDEGPDSSMVIPMQGKKGVRVSWDSSGTAKEYFVGKKVNADSSNIFDYETYENLGSTMNAGIDDVHIDENTTYTYIIKSHDGKQFSQFSDPNSIVYGLHPPSDLAAELGDSGGVSLSWKNNSANNQSNKIFRKQPGLSETFKFLNEVPPDSGGFLDMNVEPGENYSYKVKAVNDSSSSAYSNIVEITVAGQSNRPKNLMITKTTHNSITIGWDSVSSPIDGYKISRKSESENNFIFVDSTGINETTYRDSGLVEGTKYHYKVRSRYQGNESAFSNTDSGYTNLNPPSDLDAAYRDSIGVRLTWNNNSQKGTKIKVSKRDHSMGDTFVTLDDEIPRDSTGFDDVDVLSGNTYSYKVATLNDDTHSDYSNTVTIDIITTSVDIIDAIPDEFKLYQNYPNPFNPSTTINYQIKEQSFVTIKVYDILGKEISTLVDIEQNPGFYNVIFDGSGLSSGIYIYEIKAGKFKDSKKLMLLK